MTTSRVPIEPPPQRVRRKNDRHSVQRALEDICASLQPGDAIPSYADLMRQLNASERSVHLALEELHRSGRIIRRQGARTVVADQQPDAAQPFLPANMVDSRTVVGVMPWHDHGFFDRFVKLLFPHIRTAGLSLLSKVVENDADFAPESLAAAHSAGFVVFSWRLTSLARQLQDAGHRVVMVGTLPIDATPEVPTVQDAQETGGYLATRHLLDLGHLHLVFRGGDDLRQTQRWRGHQRAIAEARRRGVSIEDHALLDAECSDWGGDLEKVQAYFKRPGAPTGILAWNDHEAVLLLNLLLSIGLRVPQDVSLIGYDNLPEGELVHPPLTTVDGAIEHQLQAALDILTRPVPPPPSHTVVVLPTLIGRASTASAPNPV